MRRIHIDPKNEEEILSASEADPYRLSLSLKDFPAEDRIFITTQVGARQKARYKIPEFYFNRQVLYPSIQSVEQASSSIAARYKAALIKGGTLIDMTGGLGVDAYFFSMCTEKVIYIERNEKLAEYADHNFLILGVKNIQIVHGDSVDYLRQKEKIADVIYVDPSRRPGSMRVFRIEASEPDVTGLYRELLRKANRLIVKLSPFIDIKYLIKQFEFIREIHVLAIDHDCKEIILVLDKNEFSDDPDLITCSREKDLEHLFVTSWKKNDTSCGFDLPRRYIYDPNVAIRKTGLFNELARRFRLKKLAHNSHLFTGDEYMGSFPGRIFSLTKTLPMKDFLKTKVVDKANIATRNFPLKVQEIRKRTGIQEGGDIYLFCTSNMKNEPLVLMTEKIDSKNRSTIFQ